MGAYRGVLTAVLGVLLIAAGLAGCNSDHHHPPSPNGNAFPLKIGDVGPIAKDNPRQQPFVCMTQTTDLGKSIIDNHDKTGDAVFDDDGNIAGYSAECGAGMVVKYYYRSKSDDPDEKLHKYDIDNPPTDVKEITVNGTQVPFIVRHEEGVVNRFIYSISMLSPAPGKDPDGDIGTPDEREWNGDAVFYFVGGVGIGHTQSYSGNALDAINEVGTGQTGGLGLLKHGYAVLNSTGTATSTTYNLKLMGQTARMVKKQFVAAYGQPRYTFGLGGSGGAIQQFVYAQNDPELLDALIPLQVFPDMISIVDPVGDCALNEYFFDRTDARVNGTGSVDPKWTQWANRQMIVGFHGVDLQPGAPHYDDLESSDINTLIQLSSSASGHVGASVCMTEWFGAVPQFINPLFGSQGSYDQYYDQTVWSRTPLSFFDDVKPIFGNIPDTNLGRSTYDNVGVQYGLIPLRRGKITKKEFLKLNAHIGGWVHRQNMVEPVYPFKGDLPDDLSTIPAFIANINKFDPWSARNATAIDHKDPSDVAPRAEGSIQAMQNAYKAGLEFRGDIDQPIIIVEAYLEPELNMHASREAFEVRQRLINARGNADNLALWMIGSDESDLEIQFVLKALQVETKWLNQQKRPASLKNGCYDTSGNPIAEGQGVFKGEVGPNGHVLGGMEQASNPGACTQAFPIYSDARLQAGRHIGDHVMKCALKPVNVALQDGTYGDVHFTVQQQLKLAQIFPSGVCDYSKPGQGLPPGFTKSK